MKAIHRLAGVLLLAALILAALALRHGRSFSEVRDEVSRLQSREAEGKERIGKSRAADPDRHRRIAERMLEVTGGTTMAEEAGDGESRFRKMIASFTSDDFAGVLGELTLLEHGETAALAADLRLKLLLAWSEREPGVAASFVTNGMGPPEACRIISGTWAKKDPGAALLWARGLPEGGHRQEALIGVGNEVVSNNPQEAIELANEAGSSPTAEELLSQAAATWAGKDPRSATEWASGVTDPALREKLLTGVAMSWADQDPYAAAKLVIDSVSGGLLEENALVGIVQRIAFRDLEHARDWVEQFPESRMRERAETELARITERLGSSPPSRQQ